MALPNGDLITTVFDPQMAYPVDKRMQVDTLNSRDSMSMFIRWEGMEVYVLENSKKYILQGGRSNEYWKENGTGSGTGGTTFVGQFETADLLPTIGRSPGDYAFVGTGEDFVQYNWDNISGQWVMAEGQTDMASEHFHIGYKTPLRRPVIFRRDPKDVIIEDSGSIIVSPTVPVGNFIFTGEVVELVGFETPVDGREIHLTNRTGSDFPITEGATFGFSRVLANSETIAVVSESGLWELGVVNQVAFSDHLDSVNATRSIGPDGLEVISGVQDKEGGQAISYKEYTDTPPAIDGVMIVSDGDKNYLRAFDPTESRTLSVENVDDLRALSITDLVRLRLGYYRKVETKGYYEPGDGGGIEYTVKFDSSATDDGFLTIRPTNNLGVEFNPNIKDHIPAKIAGLKAEEGFDNRDIIVKIFAESQGKNVIFPASETYEISNGIEVSGLANSRIDFNKSTLKQTGPNLGEIKTLLRFSGISNVNFFNLELNGNKDNVTGDGMGLSIISSYDVFFDNITFRNFYYHGLYVQSGTKNIRFGKTYYDEIIGSDTASDIYISTTINDNCSFDYIHSRRSALTEIGRQCVYCDGHNTDIRTIVTLNCRNPLDYRTGKHTVGSLIADGCEYALKIGGGDFLGDPEVIAESIVATNVIGGNESSGVAGLYIVNTKKTVIQNTNITMSDTANALHAIRIRESFGAVENVVINNAYLTGFKNSGVRLDDMTNTVRIKNIRGIGDSSSAVARGIVLNNCTAPIAVRDYVFESVAGILSILSGSNTCVLSQSTINYEPIRSFSVVPSGNYTFSATDYLNYIMMEGTGNAVVSNGRIPAGRVIEGEIYSGSRTFLAGSGVTLRVMDGGTNVLPQGTYFKLIAKTTTDVLLVYDNDQKETAVLITSDFDLTTAPTQSFHLYNTSAADFIGSPDDLDDWFIKRTMGNSHTVAVDTAINRDTGESYTRAYSFGAWTPWVGAPVILNASPTLDFGAISAGSAAILTATVTGAALGDVVAVSAPASVYTSNNCTVDAWVSDVDEVSVRILNNGGSGVDPDEGTYKIKVFK